MKLALTIEYFGAAYCGWQRQKNGNTVQEELERAVAETLGLSNIAIVASGRTDSGVHALGQVCSFSVDELLIPIEKLPLAINAHLPEDISVKKAQIVSNDFNARFSAKRKTYCYKIVNNSIPSAIRSRTHGYVPRQLDIDEMQKAGDMIVGEHDFRCFRASGDKVKNTVRTVFSLKVERFFDDEIWITVTGNGFLYNMVRIIAGTLVYVGLGKLKPTDILTMLEKGDRTLAGKTMPPQGLYLVSVEYAEIQ